MAADARNEYELASGLPDHDLIGGPFSVLESDPGVFTTLIHRLGAQELDVEEVFSVGDLDRIRPHAVILCCQYGDVAVPKNVPFDPESSSLWFAHQLSDNACATTTILNLLLNCETARIGGNLELLREETMEFDPVVRGLAVSSSSWLRGIHNSVARACDLQLAFHNLSQGVTKASRPTHAKSRAGAKKRKTTNENEDETPAFHYVGYVHCHDHAWEIDGLSNGPIDLGRTDTPDSDPWIELVMQALTLRMTPLKSNGTSAGITFSLLAIVDSKYTTASDEFQAAKRERKALERRMAEAIGDNWEDKVNPAILAQARCVSADAGVLGRIFSPSFAAKNMETARQILSIRNEEELVRRWEKSVQSEGTALKKVEEELARSKRMRGQVEKLTHDYAPFVSEYVRLLGLEGYLASVGLDQDE